jgi:hypothetical protein
MSDASVPVPAQPGEVPKPARFLPFARQGTQAMIQTHRRTRRPTPEERQFLDTLIFWRAIYAERGAQDSEPGASVWSTIAAAELRMRATRTHPQP